MFEKGEFIVYGNSGVCVVDEITKMSLKGSDEKTYYKLVPLTNSASKIFTPVDNDKVVIRPVLSKDAATQLIKRISEYEIIEISEEKLREEKYKEILRSCDPVQWFKLLVTIVNRQKLRIAEGRKITSMDERYLKLVELNLFGELGVVLEENKDDMAKRIKELL